jgi:uncharacterized membrane protein YGL010W
MPNGFFQRQLASYASVHRSGRNKATHFVGIPLIAFSLLLVFTLWRLDTAEHGASIALIAAIVAALGWTALDLGIGLILAAVLAPAWYAAEALADRLGPSGTVAVFWVLFVAGWVLQLLGHHYEGKRPAFVDNVFQAFIGPMFLVAETLVAAGYRADLAASIAEGDVTAR